MENQKVRKLVLSALMAALVYVATSIIQIPSPVNGYVNLGDCFVLLSGWLLGPWYGAAAAGIDGLFMETHPDPAHAKSDGPNCVVLKRMPELLEQLKAIDALVKAQPYLEDSF